MIQTKQNSCFEMSIKSTLNVFFLKILRSSVVEITSCACMCLNNYPFQFQCIVAEYLARFQRIIILRLDELAVVVRSEEMKCCKSFADVKKKKNPQYSLLKYFNAPRVDPVGV